jgi:hypothetical protein
MSARRVLWTAGVTLYHTVRGEKAQADGSPDSKVASVLSVASLKGNAEIAVASAKSSLAGAAARTVAGEASREPIRANVAVVASTLFLLQGSRFISFLLCS